ncbi:MAG: acyltransferase family protein [Lachnospiraceae bacterium]|nr:acyltransferase family protein [Lachnospiraceae bacterium]
MRQRKNYGAIDNFRLAAALLIVAIHTAPLSSFSDSADFLVTYCLGRVAVPFFLMVTGFFVLAPYQRFAGHSSYQAERASLNMGKFLKKTAALYGIATLLYLPVKIYAKQCSHSLGGWLKEIFFDGTFYHLWYLPAVLTGCLLLMGMIYACNPLVISFLTFLLYIVGTAGDSYYQLVSQVPVFKAVYEGIFQISSYTRNGIFFAPIFLWMGVLIANGKIKVPAEKASIGLAASLAGMMAEGLLTYYMNWQKHNSMYLFLLPVMFFLFELLLTAEGNSFKLVRDLSMCVYIIHPICIILVRGGAGALKMTDLLVEQSFIHYLAVCGVSLVLSFGIAEGMAFAKEKMFSKPA